MDPRYGEPGARGTPDKNIIWKLRDTKMGAQSVCKGAERGMCIEERVTIKKHGDVQNDEGGNE